jgi:carboxyl-terminal processing protease
VDSVVLQKQKVSNDENIVKSFVLKGTQNIGYIMLPGFYSEWEAASGSHCAYDVAKEIVKLKQDNIAGLVLDLRFNGGGSLQEAIEMAGIFIDEGSVCQIRTRRKPLV